MGFGGRITFFPFLLCFVSKKKTARAAKIEAFSIQHPFFPILPKKTRKGQ